MGLTNFVLVKDTSTWDGYIPQRTWKKLNHIFSSPTLLLTEHRDQRVWNASAFGASWSTSLDDDRSVSDRIRLAAAELMQMADKIDEIDMEDSRAIRSYD